LKAFFLFLKLELSINNYIALYKNNSCRKQKCLSVLLALGWWWSQVKRVWQITEQKSKIDTPLNSILCTEKSFKFIYNFVQNEITNTV